MKLPQLTFTRFIAAIAIVIYHFRLTTFPFNIDSIEVYIKCFTAFVSYFFLLSGFILFVSGSNKLGYKKFYINRFARIYPLYLFALLCTLIFIYSARTPTDTVNFNKVFLSVFVIQAWFEKYALVYNFPAWSLSVEAFFYLIFPLVIYIFRNVSLKAEIIIIGIIWVVMQIIFIVMLSRGNYYVIYHPIFHTSTFLVGITAGKFFIANQPLLKKSLKKLKFILTILMLILLALIIFTNIFSQNYYSNGLLAPVFISFIYIVALSKNKLFAFFKNKVAEYLGEISYGIYILQIPVSIAVFGFIDRTFKFSATVSFYFYVAVLIITCALAHEIIEKPFRKYIKNLLS